MINRERVIEHKDTIVNIHSKEIFKINLIESIRILGVYITPVLSWKSNFEVLRKKIIEAIGKVIRIELIY